MEILTDQGGCHTRAVSEAYDQGREIKTHSESLNFLKDLGFKVSPGFEVCKNADEVWKAVEKIGTERWNMYFGIDGAVVKVDDLNMRKIIGTTTHAPRWATAFKFPAEKKYTRILNIEVNVGRSGALTPLAILEPVKLAGSTISKATLHNLDFVRQRDINIGDRVLIQKAGDVIPEVLEVDFNVREGSGNWDNVKRVPFEMPEKCPVCGSPVVHEEGESAYRCEGIECPARIFRGIVHFASREAMSIDGLGPAQVGTFLEKGLISNIADIYYLKEKKEELINLERMGKRSVEKLLDAIEKSKENDLDKVLFGLGIRQVGARASKDLALTFGLMDRIMAATIDELLMIQDFGQVTAESVYAFMRMEQSIHTINRLRESGVNMESKAAQQVALQSIGVPVGSDNAGIIDRRFEGMTFVLTGTLPTLKRDEAQRFIEARGGKCSGSVSSKTTFVLAGEDAGSKLDKANNLGINVIDEAEFWNMIKGD
jgi:DNA ligase (NAD+)